MKKTGLWALVWVLACATASAGSGATPPTLVIATYDSFVAKHSLGAEIFPLFEKKCGCRIKTLASGDGAQLLSRLALDAERGKPTAQIVLGLDPATWERAKPYLEEWGAWAPRGLGHVVAQARVGAGFLPFDYGVLAFMSDAEALKAAHLEAPRRLADLLKPEWRRNVILEDPRTSTPGLGFMFYGDAVGGPGFWGKFRTQWLTLAPGWDGAYGLFLKKQAPLVWSYTTSQAYHEEHGDSGKRYRALVFEEGNPIQVEGAALVKGAFEGPSADLRRIARDFLEFLISPEVQKLVPLGNWMLPVMPGTRLPASFKSLPSPLRIVATPASAQETEKALARWKSEIGQRR